MRRNRRPRRHDGHRHGGLRRRGECAGPGHRQTRHRRPHLLPSPATRCWIPVWSHTAMWWTACGIPERRPNPVRPATAGSGIRSAVNSGEMGAAAATVSRGSDGLFFHPYLQGEITPYLDDRLRASFVGATGHHTRAHFNRAVLEGIAYSLKDCYATLARLSIAPQQAVLIGGGARDPLWRQIMADMLGIPLHTISNADSSLGSAMLAGVAAGVFASHQEAADKCIHIQDEILPDPAGMAFYEEHFALYKQIQAALAPSLSPAMRILCLIKQVPDSLHVPMGSDLTLQREFTAQILNHADESAVELALRLRDAHGGSVTALTMGPAGQRAPCGSLWRAALTVRRFSHPLPAQEPIHGPPLLPCAPRSGPWETLTWFCSAGVPPRPGKPVRWGP